MSLLTGLAGWEARAEQAHYRVGELAELLGYSPNYLRRYFREKFGFNLRARLQQLRLRRLKLLV